jgi:ABC-2 type transport system permease protein
MTSTLEVIRPTAPSVPVDAHLTFPRIVKSEWIKLRSLRSTIWALIVTVVVMVGFSVLIGFVAHNIAKPSTGGPGEGPPSAGMNNHEVVQLVNTFGYHFAVLVVAVLGVLLITGEYGTGMIRSTMAAVPQRIPALIAKYLVVGVTTFVVSAVAIAISYLVTKPILGRDNLNAGLNGETLRVFLSCALLLAMISMFALAIGALMRHSAGAISTVLGILLLVPIILGILGNFVSWAGDIAKWMPDSLANRMIATTTDSGDLTPLQGFGMLALYVVVLGAASAVLLRRRDV